MKIKLLFMYAFFGAMILFAQEKSDSLMVNQIMDEWHQAATEADSVTYFDKIMASDAIFIGTDDHELWSRDQMKEKMKRAFSKAPAWDFTVLERNTYFSSEKTVAWLDELLHTWMGVCRGSGVLEKIKGEWKLKHYHLAIAVPNEVVRDYLKLLETKKED